ncbi:MAG TPA: hypothetical protein VK483_08080 [Chitinophagaceae bacterium]|nr:hypothetical protein [Chitinophagaceae bacterium]
MKQIFIVMAACLLSISARTQIKKFRDIIGSWDITGEQNTGASLQIIDSSTIVLTYMGERKNITYYKIDFTKSPIWFDFTTNDSTSTVQVKSLLQILGDDMIKWQLFVDEDRPDHFSSSKGELFYLKRSKSNISSTVVNN